MFNVLFTRLRHGVCVLALICILAGTGLAQTATQPAGDRITTITFAIPGSAPDATSKAIVALPAEYAKPEAANVRWPVVYLLHGYSGNQGDWYQHTNGTDRALDKMADRFGVIIVLPDGKFSSWYMDAVPESPESADWQWETVITKRLIPEIDKRYRTWAEPAGRGITGLSMGGYGSMFLGARHPELFSACGTMSGALDLRPLKNKYDLDKRIGNYDKNPQRWAEYSVITQAEKFAGRPVSILIDCGLEDTTFIIANQELHRRLLELKVPHDYIERPGAHTWSYWVNVLPYHLQFMSDRLKKAQ